MIPGLMSAVVVLETAVQLRVSGLATRPTQTTQETSDFKHRALCVSETQRQNYCSHAEKRAAESSQPGRGRVGVGLVGVKYVNMCLQAGFNAAAPDCRLSVGCAIHQSILIERR